MFGSLWAQCPISASGGMLALWEDGAQETGCMKGSQHHLCLAGVSKSFVFACSHISSMPNLGGRPIFGSNVPIPIYFRRKVHPAPRNGAAPGFPAPSDASRICFGGGCQRSQELQRGMEEELQKRTAGASNPVTLGDPSGWFGAPRFGFEPVLVGWESLQNTPPCKPRGKLIKSWLGVRGSV